MSICLTTSGGVLQKGDIITFDGGPQFPWFPWYTRIWYCLRYLRHNNPMYKEIELKQFIVTTASAQNYNVEEFAPND